MSTVLRQINRELKQRNEALAAALPADVVRGVCDRAVEAVGSGEPHKVTGGWVASPWYGKHSVQGLLLVATKALREAQMRVAGY